MVDGEDPLFFDVNCMKQNDGLWMTSNVDVIAYIVAEELYDPRSICLGSSDAKHVENCFLLT